MQRSRIEKWAQDSDVALTWVEDLDRNADFRTNFCIDFGKYLHQAPAFVLKPCSREELKACVTLLRDEATPWKIRGSGHSSGGQVLTNGGAVVSMAGLHRVLEIRCEGATPAEAVVEGGATWLEVVRRAAVHGLRPPVLTDNLRTTVSGTLAVGGFGDTSIHNGLQLGSVSRLTLLTPDGSEHDLDEEAPLFPYVLGGRGQLGVIVEARLRLLPRQKNMCGRVLRWFSLEQFLFDAELVQRLKLYEFFRATLRWPADGEPFSVEAVVGNFTSQSALAVADPADALLRPELRSPIFFGDRLAHAEADPIAQWSYLCPSVELVFAIPDGIKTLQEICEMIAESSLARCFPGGSALTIVPYDPRFPLAPLPRASRCIALALRPQLHGTAEVDASLPLLRRIATLALRAGARLYLASIDITHPGELSREEFLQLQFGDALSELRRYKRALDPRDLLNRGLLGDD